MPGKLLEVREQRARLNPPVFDADVLDRANDVLESMRGSFREWLEADVARLHEARLACVAQNWSDASLEALQLSAHDLKGMGETYEYPLVSQLAASLGRLFEDGAMTVRAATPLVLAHVDAIRAAVRDEIKSDSDPIGAALLTALRTQVAARVPQP